MALQFETTLRNTQLDAIETARLDEDEAAALLWTLAEQARG